MLCSLSITLVPTYSLLDGDNAKEEFADCISETSDSCKSILPAESIPEVSSVKQPAFFRTRCFSTPLYPSRCYAIPDKSCMLDCPAVVRLGDGIHERLFQKDATKAIQFIGVNAVSFAEGNPRVDLKPLPEEVGFRLWRKD